MTILPPRIFAKFSYWFFFPTNMTFAKTIDSFKFVFSYVVSEWYQLHVIERVVFSFIYTVNTATRKITSHKPSNKIFFADKNHHA